VALLQSFYRKILLMIYVFIGYNIYIKATQGNELIFFSFHIGQELIKNQKKLHLITVNKAIFLK
jgi:hypothetical protein